MLELLPDLVPGVVMTIVVTTLSAGFGLAFAVLTGIARLSRWKLLRYATTIYVEVFRGTSLLVQIFYIYFVLPILGIRLDPLPAGVLALSLNFGAYGSEIVRAAIVNVDPSQTEAAAALNMSRGTTLRRVVLPQAAAAMLLPFGNLLVELLKGSALISLISIADLAFIAKLQLFQTGQPALVYGLVLILYAALALPISRTTRWLHGRAVGRLHLGRTT